MGANLVPELVLFIASILDQPPVSFHQPCQSDPILDFRMKNLGLLDGMIPPASIGRETVASNLLTASLILVRRLHPGHGSC